MTEVDISRQHVIHVAVEYQRRGTPHVHMLITSSEIVANRIANGADVPEAVASAAA
jgi:hypothetical protein